MLKVFRVFIWLKKPFDGFDARKKFLDVGENFIMNLLALRNSISCEGEYFSC